MTSLRRRLISIEKTLSEAEEGTRRLEGVEDLEYQLRVVEERLRSANSVGAPVACCYKLQDGRHGAMVACDYIQDPQPLSVFKSLCLQCQLHVAEHLQTVRSRLEKFK